MARVAGKVALISGAGFGQGRSHAVRLAEEGAGIAAVDPAAPYDAAAHPQYAAATAADLEETKSLVEKAGRRLRHRGCGRPRPTSAGLPSWSSCDW